MGARGFRESKHVNPEHAPGTSKSPERCKMRKYGKTSSTFEFRMLVLCSLFTGAWLDVFVRISLGAIFLKTERVIIWSFTVHIWKSFNHTIVYVSYEGNGFSQVYGIIWSNLLMVNCSMKWMNVCLFNVSN